MSDAPIDLPAWPAGTATFLATGAGTPPERRDAAVRAALGALATRS